MPSLTSDYQAIFRTSRHWLWFGVEGFFIIGGFSEEELIDLVKRHRPDYIIAGTERMSCLALDAMKPTVRIISRCGVGMDGIDLEYAKKIGIKVMNTPDAPTAAVAELTLGVILDLLRQISRSDKGVRRGEFTKRMGELLSRKTVGIIGCGRIGSHLASILKKLGCRVIGFDPVVRQHTEIEMRSFDDVVREADIVTLHMPFTGENYHFIDEGVLQRMKPTSYLINAARGGLVDEDALYAALTEGIDCIYHFAGVGDIGECEQAPEQVVVNNILATVSLLEECHVKKLQRFVLASSAYVLSRMGGFYRTSKRACEGFVQDYYDSYGIDYTILRYGSLYGARANMKNGIYKLCKRLLEAKDCYNHEGAGDEYREFVNVADAAGLSVDVIEKKYPSKVFMITGMEKYKMFDLIQLVQEIIGKRVPVKYSRTKRGHYKMTPYNYYVEKGVKLVSNPYHDMGQGIIDMIKEIEAHE